MMRPQEHEMTLPSRLFRWRGYDGSPQVTTFRVANGYTGRELTREHIEASLTHLPDGIEDTMCFVGVGDHGGGPTESHIQWLREHWDTFPNCTLEFSRPARFFLRKSPEKWNLCRSLPANFSSTPSVATAFIAR
jgi:alpha-mannosidase